MLVAGASGFTGALAAQIVWRHPKLELVAVTSRSDAGKRLDSLYPRYRVPLELTELDLDEIEEVDAAIVAYPHGASAPAVAALRGLGALVVDLSADFRLRDLPTYERWYGEHGAPELLEGAVYGLTELYREQLREAELVATPGCYPTASVLALAPLAERGLLADVVIDAKQGVSGAGRGGGDAMHYVAMDENAFAYKTEGHRHRPEIEQELAALGSAGAGHLRPAPAAARPGRADQLLRADERADLQGRGAGALPRALRRRALRPRRRRPARPARRARYERVPRLRHGRGAGQGARLLGDRQPLEGRLRPGRAEPQPDARPRRDRGAEFRCAFYVYAR